MLFVCSRNRLRSPTAEQLFADWPGIETASAGTASDADVVLTSGLIEWADVVLVMQTAHRARIVARFKSQLARKRVVCLGIPDDYAFMDRALIALLRERVPPHLRTR